MHIHLHVVNEHAPSRPENLRYGTMPDPIDWGCEKCRLERHGSEEFAGDAIGIELREPVGGGQSVRPAEDRLCEGLRIVWFHQCGMRRDLRDGRGAGGGDGAASRHRFQQDDAEALLDAGQAEHVAAIVLGGELRARDVA